MLILSGDIGGTKTRLALFSFSDGTISMLHEEEFPSQEHNSFASIVSKFTGELDQHPAHACFGVAGPILGQRSEITNLPWTVDARNLKSTLGLQSAHLINDLAATAWGLSMLGEDDIYTLQHGTEVPDANCSIIAAGTGLGQAGMIWNGIRHLPFASEGGHCDFSPNSQLECDLLLYLKNDRPQVCWEDLLSGPGLVTIFSYLLSINGAPIPEWLETENAAEKISQCATEKENTLCIEAMKIFTRMYGAEAGNQALKLMARGGVYIGGGIAPKILSWLKDPEFLRAFNNKGKMRVLMESMPVHVILNDRAALYGPAIYIQEMVLQN